MHNFKHHFPLFDQRSHLVYLDAGATCPKPKPVMLAEREYEETLSTNVGRGLYPLAEETTSRFETVRSQVAHFIGATSENEIIFTSGTTASLNLAAMLLTPTLRSEHHIITTALEHHSNYLPWIELARTQNIGLHLAPFTQDGCIDTEALLSLVNAETKIVALSALSNVFGVINPIAPIIQKIRAKNPDIIIVVDAAQVAGHHPLRVQEWDADLVAFSGHKMYGPTGIGVLFGKQALLETFTPVTFGGGMVLDACSYPTEYKPNPFCFEAGTPNISGVLGLGAAIQFLETIGFETIRTHEKHLLDLALTKLKETCGVSIQILGPNTLEQRSGLISFTLQHVHPHDLAHILGEQDICIRAGEHCAAPLHRALDLPATARISFGLYNTEDDIEKLIKGLQKAQQLLLT
ncbi:MAG: aminotransferase class V-fold PLP-dependent enzyme [Candidatus Moranbacteria bacterium]|jgi:cysteine desulfurase/selenocysteine lyase|nr:aminotransferase class V-fold PLP-dependent enzyme [Candidatus Moranbacteria bacterium]MBP9801076.1 aminotransferase class V-fold PLP-dependent enzyme [Candidatus Moranbacteria bacterium]